MKFQDIIPHLLISTVLIFLSSLTDSVYGQNEGDVLTATGTSNPSSTVTNNIIFTLLPPPLTFNATNHTVIPGKVPSSTRIMGVGWGLFLSIMVGVLMLTVCIAVSQEDYAGFIYTGCLAFLTIVVIILVYAPKVKVGSVPVVAPQVDGTYIPRILFVVFITASSLVGLAGILLYYVMEPVYAIHPNDY